MATAIATSVEADLRRPRRRFNPDQFRAFANLAEAFFFNANTNSDLVAYDQAQIDIDAEGRPRQYVSTLQRTSKQRVLKIAAQLGAWKVKPGETVAVLSLNRPEWTEAEMAIYSVGAVAVAVYVRTSQERLQHILYDSGPRCAIVENEEQLARVLQLANGQSSAVQPENRACENNRLRIEHILTFEDTVVPVEAVTPGLEVKSLRQVLAEQPLQDEQSFAYQNTKRDDLATIYYTSGSSGLPVGVPVSHGQTLENLHQIAVAELLDYASYELNPLAPQPFVTLMLPERAHAFPARTAQLAATSPVRARYPAIADRKSSQVSESYRDSIRQDLREGAAGIVPIVPKILVAIQQRIRERLSTGSLGERLVARFVVENAVRKILDESIGTRHRLTEFLYRALEPLRTRIVRKIRSQVVGPEFGFFISGGAKLPLETAAFLWAINLPVYEGYGSTESNCPVATNTPVHHRLGSVGKLFYGVETRIDPANGELWLRGPNVVSRYWNIAGDRPSVWTEDGWYRTRDIGRLDTEGFLYIEDRVDNILVCWNGENVSAAAIEQRFCMIPYVDTAVVLGHQRPVLVALVALNEAMLRRWANRSGHVLATDWCHDPAVLALLRQQIELHVNSRAGHPCERIRHFGVIDVPALEDQTLTATEKVRRREIERRYAGQIEQLYQDQTAWLPSFELDPDSDAKCKSERNGASRRFFATSIDMTTPASYPSGGSQL